MLTQQDLEAFCDVPASAIDDTARRHGLTYVAAIACAQAGHQAALPAAIPTPRPERAARTPDHAACH